jgi:hypothetical protein
MALARLVDESKCPPAQLGEIAGRRLRACLKRRQDPRQQDGNGDEVDRKPPLTNTAGHHEPPFALIEIAGRQLRCRR